MTQEELRNMGVILDFLSGFVSRFGCFVFQDISTVDLGQMSVL